MKIFEEEEENNITVDIIGPMIPYARPIIYCCVILLVFILLFIGFAAGGYKVCSQGAGFLDNKFHCHPGYYNRTEEKIFPYSNEVLDNYTVHKIVL